MTINPRQLRQIIVLVLLAAFLLEEINALPGHLARQRRTRVMKGVALSVVFTAIGATLAAVVTHDRRLAPGPRYVIRHDCFI